jgi:PhoH-like ATPase
MKKTFVLDTNVLLHDPRALVRFEDNNVVIPIEVVEEIDRFKRDSSEKGRNARQVSRLLDGLREKGNLAEGVEIDPIAHGHLPQ